MQHVQKKDVVELVNAHRALDEPMTAAIWIHTEEPAVWLVEVLPEMPYDLDVATPVLFGPSADFRFVLHLIAGNLQSLLDAVDRSEQLARALSLGEVLYDSEDARALMDRARVAKA